MPYKTIARLIPTIQAAHLVGENIAVSKKKNITTKDMVGLGAKNIIGLGFIQAEAQLIGQL